MERIPILQMGEFLLVTIQVDMHDRLAMTLQDDLTNRITQTSARGVLIDISGLEIVDSFIGRYWETLPRCRGYLMPKRLLSECSQQLPSHWSSWDSP
jgi:rsbT antagonist protein RsbS